MGGGTADDREEAVSLPIPDEILAEIFLRLPAAADLVRASAVCVSFCRVTADRAFLRLFRKLHTRPLLGILSKNRTFDATVPPHTSAPAASAAALAADFSFSFLPDPAREWVVQDSRDGRVLLERPRQRATFDLRVAFTETVVCDPLHRRYLLLPPIPEHLTASVEDTFLLRPQCLPETFLIPPGEDEDAVAADETSFRVICMVQCKFKLFTFVFSSSTRQWRAVPSQSWIDLLPGLLRPIRSRRQYAYGCFYWIAYSMEKKTLVLDIRRMEFSIAELPPEAKDSDIIDMTMVEAGEGRLGLFMLSRGTPYLSYTIREYNGGSSSQWKIEKLISLGFQYLLGGSVGRYLFLFLYGNSSFEPGYFTLDIKTFQLEKMGISGITNPQAYSNFPPSLLSSPTVSSDGAAQCPDGLCMKPSANYRGGCSRDVVCERACKKEGWPTGTCHPGFWTGACKCCYPCHR